MSPDPSDRPDPAVAVPESLVRSGFPFQTAIADFVGRTSGWHVLTEEFPWRDELGEDHFLDVVAESDSGVILTIEAKKTEKKILTFLLPEPRRDDETRARLLLLKELRMAEETKVARLEIYCGEWFGPPPSVESSFCVVSTSPRGQDSRLLEGDAQLLIRGTDAYALGEKRSYVFHQNQPRSVQPVIPLVVTNAPIFVARYEARGVSLETGRFRQVPEHVAVDVVRFRKAFLSHPEHDRGERTVIVANAAGLTALLATLAQTAGRYEPVRSPYHP